MEQTKAEQLRQILQESQRLVFFGGAGVSTESGLKDYRSEDGLYASMKECGQPPEVILSHDFFFQNPAEFYRFYQRWFDHPEVRPNAAHRALYELEKRGILQAVITQNIDGLHQQAGSRRVLELHGSIARYHCVACGAACTKEAVFALKGKVPSCKMCGGLIKPDVVLYGEPLDEVVTKEAKEAIEQADTLLVGGTSLTVYPAAGFLRFFRGQSLVLINQSATAYDEQADLVLHEPIGQALSAAVDGLFASDGRCL